jgi:FAD:protein FMN transferase
MQEYEYTKRIMGCDAEISIVSTSKEVSDSAYDVMVAIASAEEMRFTRFQPESELSQLNSAGTMSVSPEFYETFKLGQDLTRRTEGAYNPLVDISRFGYDADISEVQNTERTSREVDPYNIDMSSIRTEDSTRAITLLPGQRLDFGGFLKGHVAEKMARSAESVQGVIVNLGGDLFTVGRDAEGKAFEFFVEHPQDPDARISCLLTNGALSTSGSNRRFWTLGGKQFHHVLDKSGRVNPSSDVSSATILAKDGASSDAFAKVGLIEGSVCAKRLQELGYGFCLIKTDGSLITSPEFSYGK